MLTAQAMSDDSHFVNYQYANTPLLTSTPSIERTLTGHVEVIEMGECELIKDLHQQQGKTDSMR